MGRRGTLRTYWLLADETEIAVEVDYFYTRGARELPPSLDHPGLPADPDEIEITCVRMVDEPGAILSGHLLKDIAESGRIYAECVLHARELV